MDGQFISEEARKKACVWFKSLRHQSKQGKKGLVLTEEQEKEFGYLFTHPSWKPTQEQIELLEKLSNHGGHYDYQNLELKKLVTQLKKL